MPSKEDYLQQAESHKDQGNSHFGRQQYDDAIQCYSQGIVAIDRISIPEMTAADTTSFYSTASLLKWTLLSNRALARIKRYETSSRMKEEAAVLLHDAIADCQTAIASISSHTHTTASASTSSKSTVETNALRAKLLYRSARARFLLANHDPSRSEVSSSDNPTSTHTSNTSLLLSEAAKDLLLLLQMDPQHVEGNRLMTVIRTQHQQDARRSSSHTPVGNILATLLSYSSTNTTSAAAAETQQKQQVQQLKLLYGLIQNDPVDTSRQVGRYTYDPATTTHTTTHTTTEATTASTTTNHNSNNTGVDLLWHLIVSGISSSSDRSMTTTTTTTSSTHKFDHVSLLGMQCISSMASQYPIFVRTYLTSSYQTALKTLSESLLHMLTINNNNNNKVLCDLMVSILSLWHSIILHSDRDSIKTNDIVGTTKLNYQDIITTLSYALRMGQYCYEQEQQYAQSTLLYRAVMDIVSVFLASTDRDHRIRMSLLNSNTSSNSSNANIHHKNNLDPELEPIHTPQEIRNFTPQQLAAHKKRQYDIKTRNEAWAYERAKYICTMSTSGDNDGSTVGRTKNSDGVPTLFRQLLTVAVSYCNPEDIIFRREMTISISRILSCLEPDTMIQDTVRPYLQHLNESMSTKEEAYIEEIYNDDDDDNTTAKAEEGKQASVEEMSSSDNNTNIVSLETKMIRAVIATAILLLSSKKECATWLFSNGGWKNVGTDVPDMIASQQIVALCYVVEMIQAAAVLEATRAMVTGWISSGSMESLMKSPHRDVRSGAAAAIAKLGLSDKVTTNDDGELMGLLQAACALFEDRDENELDHNQSKKETNNNSNKYNQYSSYATSSVERAVEMITYLVAHTTIKDEIAAGFGGVSGIPVIDLLVQAADQPGAGESMSGFSLASIFQLLAATNEQIRREAFEGKEVTMEQYDEMQRMGKTEEEKEIMDQEKDTDTKEACQERIRKMAHANVPRALVALTENASEHTLEQLTMAMNRMAEEASVRGIMIQQGVLSTCIKIEKAEGPTETDIMKKVIRSARHCIAKMLITTNPSLLTSAQKLGAVKPLILLIRDIRGSDLQHFEALLAITNIGSSGDDAKNRIVSERGIPTFHFAMFSDHEMVRRSATEALCNLVPHEKMMDHLAEVDHLRLWLAFAVDYEDHYECARAAAGCLAMATQDETIAQTLVNLDKFKTQMTALLESGRLEIMHRAFVIVYNLVLHGSKIREATIAAGLIDFCRAYIELQQHGVSVDEFTAEERNLIPVTVDIAKTIVQSAD